MTEFDTRPGRSQTSGTIDSFIGHYTDPTTAGLRSELKRIAPEKIEQFDVFAATKNDEISHLRSLLEETNSELSRERAQSASSRSSNSASLTNGFSSSIPSYGKSSSSSSGSHQRADIPMAKEATGRMPLSDSSGSNSSQQAVNIPMAKAATRRMVLSDSSASNSSGQAAIVPMAKPATCRMLLSDSSRSSSSQQDTGAPIVKAATSRMHLSVSDQSMSSQQVVGRPLGKLGIHRAPPTVSGETYLTRSLASSRPITPLELSTKQVLLEIDVKLRLLPAICILTKPELSEGSRQGAQKVVQDTLNFVRQCNGSAALLARCNFYIGVTLYVPGDQVAMKESLVWFQRAQDATLGGYPEGEWALQWLNYHKSATLNQYAESRPGSVGSWISTKISGIWNFGRSGASMSSSNSKALPKASRLRSDDEISPSSNKRPAQGDRIPSFTTLGSNSSIASESSPPRRLSRTKDHYSLQWSPNSRFGKMEVVMSPGAMSDIDKGEEIEQNIPHNVMGGFVDANNLLPSTARYPTSLSSCRKSYIPPGIDPPSPARVLRIRNIGSPLPSPSAQSPHSSGSNMSSYFTDFSGVHAIPSLPSSRGATISSSQSDPTSEATSHKRHKSVSFDPAISPKQEVPAEPASPVMVPQQSHRKRRMGSLSMITTGIATGIASGLEVAGALPHRRRSELAQQMEEGESPGFASKASEAALYRRRESDIIEEV